MPILGPRYALILGLITLASSISSQQNQAGTEPEVAVQGYNNEPINIYSETADFRKLGRGVGLLSVETDVGPFPCTAFMVDETHLMTNYHCVPGILEDTRVSASQINKVSFLAGFFIPGMIETAEQFDVEIEPIESSKSLDYSVLKVNGVPKDRFPPLPLTNSEASAGLPYWIIGHPQGLSQHISREGCRAAQPPREDERLRHTCDTLGGNSGSPIIDSSSRQVIGLHNSGNSRVGINFGIPMKLILDQSNVLKVAKRSPERALTLVFSAFPDSLSVGQELSLVADVPAACKPILIDISASYKTTPLPLEIFEQVTLSELQTRYQITATSTYGITVEEGDEKGQHWIGVLCGSKELSDPAQLKAALQLLVNALNKGVKDGQVDLDATTVQFSFDTYEVE